MRKFLEKLFPSLGKKIAFAVSIVFLTAGGAFVYFAHNTGYTMLEKGAQAKAHGVAEFGKAILEFVMLEGENDQLQAALNRAVSTHQAKNVLILGKDGSIILKSANNEIRSKLPLEQFSELPDYPGEKFLLAKEHDSLYEYIITPIIKKPDCYKCHNDPDTSRGYLAVKISMDDISAVAMKHRTTNILMTAITFLGLGGVIFLALLFVVIRPITKLRNQITLVENQVDRFEQGDNVHFSKLEVPDKHDEIAGLMVAFNKLIQRLNDAHEKLHELHQVRMEHADRLASTGVMAASLAHEIKNPIAGVLCALQVFDGEISLKDDRKEIIAEMITQLERVNHTVNDLLSYARPASPKFDEVSVNELITKTISLLSQQVKNAPITISTSLPRIPVAISADGKQIQQVLWNIMHNAVQAIDKDGSVNVKLFQDNSKIKIQIADTGAGISAEQLGCVFQPFFTTKHKGTGLGMTISKRIVEQHNGTIGIESIVGEGTTVTITLPHHQMDS